MDPIHIQIGDSSRAVEMTSQKWKEIIGLSAQDAEQFLAGLPCSVTQAKDVLDLAGPNPETTWIEFLRENTPTQIFNS